MMLRRIGSAALAVALAVALTGYGTDPRSEKGRTAVYDVVLSQIAEASEGQAILRTTAPLEMLEVPMGRGFDGEVVLEFSDTNKRPQELPAAIVERYTSISLEEFQQRGPEHPPVIYLSAIGFNSSADLALVYVGFCRKHRTHGTLYQLERSWGTWSISVFMEVNYDFIE